MNFVDAFYEDMAVKIKDKKARDEFLLAIIYYYYEGVEPTFKSESAELGFAGIRFALDKARSGRKGGKAKQQAKAEANAQANPEANTEAERKAESGKDPKLYTYTDTGTKETTSNEVAKKPRFVPPSEGEVQAYIDEKGYKVSARRFIDFYESKGWMVGKNKMTNWKSALSGWNARSSEREAKPNADFGEYAQLL